MAREHDELEELHPLIKTQLVLGNNTHLEIYRYTNTLTCKCTGHEKLDSIYRNSLTKWATERRTMDLHGKR